MAYITTEMLEDFAQKYTSDEFYYLPEKNLEAWDPNTKYYTKTENGYTEVDQSTDVFDPEIIYYTAHKAVERYVKAAEEKIKEYLGFDPELKEYSEKIRGKGIEGLRLSAPIIEIKRKRKNCTSLTSMNISKMENILNAFSMFEGCTSLTEVTVSANINNAGRMFYGCTALTTIKNFKWNVSEMTETTESTEAENAMPNCFKNLPC